MLKDNIKTIRKSKGLSQEELATKLNVVRQTISKWEQGLSVPDSELLVSLSEALDTPVSTLLGENIEEKEDNYLKEIAQKLEVINLQLSKRKETKRKIWLGVFIAICVSIVIAFILLSNLGTSYMEWDYYDPELAVMGVGIHAFIWIFVRLAPIVFIGSIIGICFTIKKK